MNKFINIILFLQYLFYKIYIFLFPIDGFDVLIKNHDNVIINNLFYYVNFIKHFHLWFIKPINENWIVRLKLNNKYFINHYNNDERIYYMLDDKEWKNNNIMMLKVNNKEINIINYNYDCLISDVLNFEIGNINDDDDIYYMNISLNEVNIKFKEINNKKLYELI